MKYILSYSDGEYVHDFIIWTDEILSIQQKRGFCIGKNVIEITDIQEGSKINLEKLSDKK